MGHLGLEIFSGMPSTARVSQRPIEFMFAVGFAGANNIMNEITVGESPIQKRELL